MPVNVNYGSRRVVVNACELRSEVFLLWCKANWLFIVMAFIGIIQFCHLFGKKLFLLWILLFSSCVSCQISLVLFWLLWPGTGHPACGCSSKGTSVSCQYRLNVESLMVQHFVVKLRFWFGFIEWILSYSLNTCTVNSSLLRRPSALLADHVCIVVIRERILKRVNCHWIKQYHKMYMMMGSWTMIIVT